MWNYRPALQYYGLPASSVRVAMEPTKHYGSYAMMMLGYIFILLLAMNAILFYWLVTMRPMVAMEPHVIRFSSLLWLIQFILKLCKS